MRRYYPGQAVHSGFYLNTRTAEIVPIGPRGGSLTGPEGTWYMRVPAALMLLLAPALGALYVVFLPLAGFAMLFRFAGGKAAEGARATAQGLTALTMPGLRLGAAFFHRRRGRKGAGRPPEGPAGGPPAA
jgi:hypothetical protein